MVKDVIYNKISIIERCMIRIKEEYNNNPENLHNYTKQDSIVLNIQRAIEAAIDIAMHIISVKKLGIPQNSRDAFEILNKHNIVGDELLLKLVTMIGFRNIAVHNYQKLSLDVIQRIVEERLVDFNDLIDAINSLSD